MRLQLFCNIWREMGILCLAFQNYHQTFKIFTCWCWLWYLYRGHWRKVQIAFLCKKFDKEQESSKSKVQFSLEHELMGCVQVKYNVCHSTTEAGIWHFFGPALKFKVACFYFPLGQLLQFSDENWPQLAHLKWKHT
jgi:hypothetical protein